MLEYNLVQLIKSPTHITKTVATCLDLIFTNIHTTNLQTITKEYGFSDHMGTIIQLKIPHKLKTESINKSWTIEKRIFNNKNIENFKLNRLNINLQDIIMPNENVNQSYFRFNAILNKILNKCIPKQKN